MSAGVRLDRLLGRAVYADGRRLGRLEEFRAERRGDEWFINEYVLGGAGLFERLGVGARLILGVKRRQGYVVRWDQLDLSDPDRPCVTCSVDQLQHI